MIFMCTKNRKICGPYKLNPGCLLAKRILLIYISAIYLNSNQENKVSNNGGAERGTLYSSFATRSI